MLDSKNVIPKGKSKNVRLISKNFVSLKIPNKRQLQETAFNHLCHIELDHFMRIIKICTNESHSLLVHETTLSSNTLLHFRNNLVEIYFTENVKINYDN